MDFSFVQNINFLAVLVAAVAYWILGALWYSPLLFSKPWARYVNFQEEWRNNMMMSMILSFIGFFITCFTVAVLVSHLVYPDLVRSIKIAVIAGIGLTAVPIWINSLYSKRPIGLFLIDAGYHFLGIVIAAIIISLWQ